MGKLKLGIAGLSDVALEGKARTCHDMCTGNVSFNFPDGLLDRLKTACDQVAQMNDQVRFYGGLIPFQEKRQAVADLRALLSEVSGYVAAQSKGDVKKILSAGFEVRRRGIPVEKLGPVMNLRPVLTNFAGEVELRWEPVMNANAYQLMICKGDPREPKDWEPMAYCSQSRHRVVGLESGRFYTFRVQALGRKGLSGPISQDVRALAA